MNESILDSTKKYIGFDESYEVFNDDVLSAINRAFATICQINGERNEFVVENNQTEWSDFTNNAKLLGLVREYVHKRARKSVDPPTSSIVMNALNEDLDELEWRISIERRRPVCDVHCPLGDQGSEVGNS